MEIGTGDGNEVFEFAEKVDEYIRGTGVCMTIASPALMILSAQAAAHALDDEEHIVSEFRRCLRECKKAITQ